MLSMYKKNTQLQKRFFGFIISPAFLLPSVILSYILPLRVKKRIHPAFFRRGGTDEIKADFSESFISYLSKRAALARQLKYILLLPGHFAHAK